MPRAASSRMRASEASRWSISKPSVNSRIRARAGVPCSASAACTREAKSGWRNWAGLTFTDRATGVPACASRLAARHASRSAQCPSLTISPDSSAMGMKMPGAIKLPSGCGQRISNSAPVTRPWRSTCGCTCMDNRLASSARASARSRVRRRSTSACMAASKKAMPLRPSALARYMAISASRSRSCACCCAFGSRVTPMLALQ